MNITYLHFELGVMPVIGEHRNVVRQVRFGVTWQKGGASSTAFVEALLDVAQLTDFRPIETLSKDDLIVWGVAAQGGQAFLDRLAEFHVSYVERQLAQAGVVSYTGHFMFDNGAEAPASSADVFAPIFPTAATGSIGVVAFE